MEQIMDVVKKKSYTCSLPSHKGVQCGPGSSIRYYYDSQNQECVSFQYNGCDGNSNNFPNVSFFKIINNNFFFF